MGRYTRTQITQLSANESAAIQQINKNFEDLQDAIQDTVSRSGQAPTHMTADLDLNGKRIINVPAPLTDNDLVRRVDVVEDIETVQSLVNTASTAAGQAIAAAEGVQEAIADAHVGVVADDLILGDDSKIRIVANNMPTLEGVIANETNINTVASDLSNIETVADSISNVDTVASNVSDIGTCVTNMADIQAAPGAATTASNAALAAAASASSAAMSAASARLYLFKHEWADHEVDNMAWLRADTFSWQDGTVYTDAYNHLVDDIDGKTATSETIGSYTISYYLADDGHKITTDESTVANIYNATGVAWYYVLDTVNQRFKLPRINPDRETLLDVIPVQGGGNLLGFKFEDSSSDFIVQTGTYNSGAKSWPLQAVLVEGNTPSTDPGQYKNMKLNSTPSKSGIVARESFATGTYKGNKYLYFYVGQFSQTAVEQTAGLNASLFNGKVDLNARNLNTEGKSYVSSLSYLSDTYNNLTLGASGAQYEAPANGAFAISKVSGGTDKYVNMYNETSHLQIRAEGDSSATLSIWIPVKKGDIVTVTYTATGTLDFFRFIYAEGEV